MAKKVSQSRWLPKKRERTWGDELKFMHNLPKAFRLTRLPIIGKYLYRSTPVGDPEARNWIIPVNQVIQRGKSMALPMEVITALFQKAGRLKRSPACVCRTAYECQRYPHDIACVWMGENSKVMPAHWGDEISYDEAIAHAKNALAHGLVPSIVYDKTMVRLLALCFCCDCCCDIRLGLRLGPMAFWERVLPPPGVTAVVDETCSLCGECIRQGLCVVKAISLGATRAEIDMRTCVACGRCAEVCPMSAIHFEIDPEVNVVEMLLSSIAERTDITGTPSEA
jgi:ferredoxin